MSQTVELQIVKSRDLIEVPKHEDLGTFFYFYTSASATAGASPGEQAEAVRAVSSAVIAATTACPIA